MAIFLRGGLLASFFLFGVTSLAAAEKQKPCFGRWARAKLTQACRLVEPREAVGAALNLWAVMHSPEAPSLPVGTESTHGLDGFTDREPLFAQSSVKLLFDRGSVRMSNNELGKALADFNECVRLAPMQAAPWIARGKALGCLGEYEQAITNFDRAVLLEPKLGPAYRWRAMCRLATGDAEGALADFDRLVLYDPQAAAFAARALGRMMQGCYEKAIEDFDRACEMDVNGPNFLLGRAMARFNNRDYPWAIEDLDQLLARRPSNSGTALFCRAIAWHKLGQTQKACADIFQACKFGKSRADLMQMLDAKNVHFVVSSKKLEWRFMVVGSEESRKPNPIQLPSSLEPARANEKQLVDYRGGAKSETPPVRSFNSEFFKPALKRELLATSDPVHKPAPAVPQQPAQAVGEQALPDSWGPRVIARWLTSSDFDAAQALTTQAWLLATSRYESARDGVRAVEAARAACELTEWRASGCLEALAAAYAECGDFESADKYQTLAEELAADGPSDARHAAARRHALYRDRRPVHQGE